MLFAGYAAAAGLRATAVRLGGGQGSASGVRAGLGLSK